MPKSHTETCARGHRNLAVTLARLRAAPDLSCTLTCNPDTHPSLAVFKCNQTECVRLLLPQVAFVARMHAAGWVQRSAAYTRVMLGREQCG